jgi:hypothetical protein
VLLDIQRLEGGGQFSLGDAVHHCESRHRGAVRLLEAAVECHTLFRVGDSRRWPCRGASAEEGASAHASARQEKAHSINHSCR